MVLAKLQALYNDSLFRNSAYLILATVVVSGFGFLFWLITAHLYSTEDIGLATALISTMNLVSLLSLLGFNTVFIRFLSKSENAEEEISTGMILVGVASLCIALLVVLFVSEFSPRLHFIQAPGTALLFILFSALTALNTLVESLYLAFRKTEFTLINSTIYSGLKLVFPIFFVGFGAIGVFVSAALAQAVGLILGLYVIRKHLGFRLRFMVSPDILVRTWKYSSFNYTAAVFNLLPISLLPIIITNHLGPTSAAYFYIAMMIGNLLYVIPWSTSKSLFAEGSFDDASIVVHIRKAIRINVVLVIPAILLTLVLSRFVLAIFGQGYATDAVYFLWMVALAAIPITVNSLFGALLQVKKDPRSLIITNIFYGIALIILSYLFLGFGLNGIGYAWILGNCTAALVSGASYFWGDRFYARVASGTYVPRMIIRLKLYSLYVCIRNGFKRKTVLFYPHKPHWYHVTYVVMHRLGYRITNNPNARFDIAISWEDTTYKVENKITEKLRSTTRFVNGSCMDISKSRVAKVFQDVFGYQLTIDPRTHEGLCVQKSEINGLHDGAIVTCPMDPQDGFVYEKLINNIYDEDTIRDIRIVMYGHTIPFVIYRYRNVSNRFSKTQSIQIVRTEDALSQNEITQLISFCGLFGLEYGEIDVVRDHDDGRIYVVDTNLTCGGPVCGIHLSRREYWKFIDTHASCFTTTFLRSTDS